MIGPTLGMIAPEDGHLRAKIRFHAAQQFKEVLLRCRCNQRIEIIAQGSAGCRSARRRENRLNGFQVYSAQRHRPKAR